MYGAESERAVGIQYQAQLVLSFIQFFLLCWLVSRAVGPSVTFLNSERFLHYCSCPTVRDWIAVYPALFLMKMGILPFPLIKTMFSESFLANLVH